MSQRRLPRRPAATAATLLGAAVLMVLALTAGAQPHPHKKVVREEIESLEEQWKQATMSNDLATMDKLLSDDYLGVTINGELVTKAQQMDRMRNRKVTITSLDVSDMKIKVTGQMAIVNALAQVEGSSDGTPLHGGFRYVRIYQYVPAGQHISGGLRGISGMWKITSFQVTRIPHDRHQNAPPQ